MSTTQTLVVLIAYLLLHVTLHHNVFQMVESFSSNGRLPRKFGILLQQEGLACRCNSFSFTFLHDDVHWKLYSTRQGIDAEMGDDLKNKNLLLLSKIADYFNPKRPSRPRSFADSTYLYNISDVYGGQENLLF
jgi:hypothetical protein